MGASSNRTSEKPTDSPQEPYTSEQLEQLRELLIGPERQTLTALQRRLDDPVRKAEELSRALPDAIALSAARDDAVARAMQPTIDTSLKVSVSKNPKMLADAIYPALGPAIRKSIAATLMGMIQSLNEALNHSVSIRGLKWRLEALRTRRPFAEVVLLNTLVYRVEQIFLIHRQTGLVLQHVELPDQWVRDPDLVSGMLTAVQDFVQDSFSAESGSDLDTLRMAGDRSVWIEQGPQAVLAVVVQGTPPMELRRQFTELLETIHLKYSSALAEFSGDVAAFAMLRNSLESGLQSRFKDKAQRRGPTALLWVLILVVLGFAGWAIYGAHHRHALWENYVQQLRSEPGLVLTATGRRDGRYYVAGLRDPLAEDPLQMLANAGIDPENIDSRWDSYHSFDPAFALLRAQKRLQPPQGVKLNLADGTLTAQGSAGHRWIVRSRSLATGIPGVTAYDDTRLEDTDVTALADTTRRLEAATIYFKLGSVELAADQEALLRSVTADVQRIQSIQARLAATLPVTILGHTDPSGSADLNRRLSQQRADQIRAHLIRNGVQPGLLEAVGLGVAPSAQASAELLDRELYRTVTFTVVRFRPGGEGNR